MQVLFNRSIAKYPLLSFLVKDVKGFQMLQAVPLFHFYKDGVLLEKFATRDKERILAAIRKYSSADI